MCISPVLKNALLGNYESQLLGNRLNWPIMMPAQGVTLADSDDWRRVHRLDLLRLKKPAKLLGYQALTLK